MRRIEAQETGLVGNEEGKYDVMTVEIDMIIE